MNNTLDKFCCPKCSGWIARQDGNLRCQGCQTLYSIRDGIIDFRVNNTIVTENPTSALANRLSAYNWPQIVRSFVNQAVNKHSAVDDLTSHSRYAWKLLLDLKPHTTFLHIGCEFGNLTSNIVPHVGKIYAVDLDFSHLQFAKRRCSIFQPHDDIIFVALDDATRLPFQDESIDCVVLSGILARLGEEKLTPSIDSTEKHYSPEILLKWFKRSNSDGLQINFLRETRRILKSTGQLFIACENLLNFTLSPLHPNQRTVLTHGAFGSKRLAYMYSIVLDKLSARGRIHSIAGYEWILRRAGFQNTECFGLWKDDKHLDEITPADTRITNWQPYARRGLKEKIKFNKYFMPAFGIIASSANKDSSRLLDRLVAQIEQQLSLQIGDNPLIIRRYLVSKKEKLVIQGDFGKLGVIVKIPLNDAAFMSAETNALHLKHLYNADNKSKFFPKLLLHGEINKLHYFVETQITGYPLGEFLRSKGRTSMLASVSRLLDELNPKPSLNQVHPFTGQLYEQHVENRLSNLFEVVHDQSIRKQLQASFHKILYGIDVYVGLTHGDLSLSNILVANNRIAGLIDWDAASSNDLPILDAIHYLRSANQWFNSDGNILQGVKLLTTREWPIAEERDLLIKQYKKYQMDPAHHNGLVYLYWLRNVTTLLLFWLKFDPSALDLYVYKIIKTLLSEMEIT